MDVLLNGDADLTAKKMQADLLGWACMIDAWGKRGILLNMYSVGEGEPVVGGELEGTDE